MAETSSDLVKKCDALLRDGVDFPTVWQTELRNHPLVVGLPIQSLRDGHVHLEIHLMTGERIIYNSKSNEFSFDQRSR